MHNPIIALLSPLHKKRIILKLEMPPLHAYFPVDRLEVDGLRIKNLKGHAVDIRQLIPIGIDLPIKGIALQHCRARRRRRNHNPRPQTRDIRIAPIAHIFKKLLPQIKSRSLTHRLELFQRRVLRVKLLHIMGRIAQHLITSPRRQLLDKQSIGFQKREPHRIIIDLLQPHHLSTPLKIARNNRRYLLILQHILIPENQIINRKRMPI